MIPPNLTGSALAAWHRSEADRIEAEERARRPALAACPFCGCEDIREEEEEFCLRIVCNSCYAQARSVESWNARVSARDVLRVVPPEEWSDIRGAIQWSDSSAHWNERRKALAEKFKAECLSPVPPDPPAPQVAPEPTGAELVGRRCWVKDEEDESEWFGPFRIEAYHGPKKRTYETMHGVKWDHAKPCVEGVAP